MLTNYTSNAQPAPTTTMPAVGEFEAPTNPGGVFQPSVGGLPANLQSAPVPATPANPAASGRFTPGNPHLQMSNFPLHPLVLTLLLHPLPLAWRR